MIIAEDCVCWTYPANGLGDHAFLFEWLFDAGCLTFSESVTGTMFGYAYVQYIVNSELWYRVRCDQFCDIRVSWNSADRDVLDPAIISDF